MTKTDTGQGKKRAASSNEASREEGPKAQRRKKCSSSAAASVNSGWEDSIRGVYGRSGSKRLSLAKRPSADSGRQSTTAQKTKDKKKRGVAIIEEDASKNDNAPNLDDARKQEAKKEAKKDTKQADNSSSLENRNPGAQADTTENNPSSQFDLLLENIKILSTAETGPFSFQKGAVDKAQGSLEWLLDYLQPDDSSENPQVERELRRSCAIALGVYPALGRWFKEHEWYRSCAEKASRLFLVLISGIQNHMETFVPLSIGFIEFLLNHSVLTETKFPDETGMICLQSLSSLIRVGDTSPEVLAVNCAFLRQIQSREQKEQLSSMLRLMFEKKRPMSKYPDLFAAWVRFINTLVLAEDQMRLRTRGGIDIRDTLLKTGVVAQVGKLFDVRWDDQSILKLARKAIHNVTSSKPDSALPTKEIRLLIANAGVIPQLYNLIDAIPHVKERGYLETKLQKLKEILYDKVPDTWDDLDDLRDIKQIHAHAIALGAYPIILECMQEHQNNGHIQELGACIVGSLVFECPTASDVLIPIELGVMEHAITTIKKFPLHDLVGMYMNLISNMIAQTAWDDEEETAKVNKAVLSKLKRIDSAFSTLFQVLDRAHLSESPFRIECSLKLINNLIDSDENLQDEDRSDVRSLLRSHGAIAKVGRLFEAFPTNDDILQLSRETIHKLVP